MSDTNVLRSELVALLNGGNAHAGFEGNIGAFPTDKINEKLHGMIRPPDTLLTPWHLLEHMRIAQWDILEFVRNPSHVSPDWPKGYWPSPDAEASVSQWEESMTLFHLDKEALLSIVQNPETDFFSPLPHAPDYTIFREIVLVADHNSYHIGQFGVIKDVVGASS